MLTKVTGIFSDSGLGIPTGQYYSPSVSMASSVELLPGSYTTIRSKLVVMSSNNSCAAATNPNKTNVLAYDAS